MKWVMRVQQLKQEVYLKKINFLYGISFFGGPGYSYYTGGRWNAGNAAFYTTDGMRFEFYNNSKFRQT